MAKVQTRFYCQSCGAHSSQWIGKCPSCGKWNTYVEEKIEKTKNTSSSAKAGKPAKSIPRKIGEVNYTKEKRLFLKSTELNRVLGGGLVYGSVVLVGGEPGIGKSTLLLQMSVALTRNKVLYISGEESEEQIRMRAERIGYYNAECYIYAETELDNIIEQIQSLAPDIVIVDSVQTLHSSGLESAAGTVSQIRECASELQQYAKFLNTPVFLVGHITKEGSLAGPKVLEHMVDTVLQFEGDPNYGYRILRTLKNRFGSTSELGIFEMDSSGLREVINPSEILLSQQNENLSGVAISASVEGIRPILIEVQALVSTAAYGTPQRSATGFDVKRLNMLLAVLEKRNGFKLNAKDVFLNIAGGLKVNDPAIDLGIIAAVLSSNEDLPLNNNICFAAEVGLSGEIRSVNKLEQRIKEADKLGFERIYISKHNSKAIKDLSTDMEIIQIKSVRELYLHIFD